jgi:hypothetical protein
MARSGLGTECGDWNQISKNVKITKLWNPQFTKKINSYLALRIRSSFPKNFCLLSKFIINLFIDKSALLIYHCC